MELSVVIEGWDSHSEIQSGMCKMFAVYCLVARPQKMAIASQG